MVVIVVCCALSPFLNFNPSAEADGKLNNQQTQQRQPGGWFFKQRQGVLGGLLLPTFNSSGIFMPPNDDQ